MSFVSYAQNFEDVLLWRALRHVDHGCYIDIGAEHPVNDSVSRAFYEHGWRGVHAEPSPFFAQLLRENRPDEKVIEKAVGVSNGDVAYYEVPKTGLSSCDPTIAQMHREAGFTVNEKNVASTTLAEIMEPFSNQEVHWLKIDVEGWEKFVLQGWLPSQVRPWIVVVESTLPNSQVETHHEWENLVLDLDYEFVFFDGLSRYYVSNQHPELKPAFCVGANIYDDFLLAERHGKCALAVQRLTEREKELGAEISRERLEAERLGKSLVASEQAFGDKIAESQAETERLGQLVVSLAQDIVSRAAQGKSSRVVQEDSQIERRDDDQEITEQIAKLKQHHDEEVARIRSEEEERRQHLAVRHEARIQEELAKVRAAAEELAQARLAGEQKLLEQQREHEATVVELERSESFLQDELEKSAATMAKVREDHALELQQRSGQVAALERKLHDLQVQHDQQRQSMENLRIEREQFMHSANRLHEKIKLQEVKLKQQMRYRLGDVLISAIDHPLQLFTLPWRMTKLLVKALSGRKWRLETEKTLKKEERGLPEITAPTSNSRFTIGNGSPVSTNSHPQPESEVKKKLEV